jgi:hypothetical protein
VFLRDGVISIVWNGLTSCIGRAVLTLFLLIINRRVDEFLSKKKNNGNGKEKLMG